MKVICAAISDKCPKKCVHSVPHEPIWDRYTDIESEEYYYDGTCDVAFSDCGWVRPKARCRCENAPGELRRWEERP